MVSKRVLVISDPVHSQARARITFLSYAGLSVQNDPLKATRSACRRVPAPVLPSGMCLDGIIDLDRCPDDDCMPVNLDIWRITSLALLCLALIVQGSLQDLKITVFK